MKVLKRHLRWVQSACLATGGLMLLWCAWSYADMRMFQARQTREFESSRSDARSVVTGPLKARLRIPSIGLSAMVVEGVDSRSLRHAVGHIPGTAPPGVAGTVGLAGHRDTFFLALGRVRDNEEIFLETAGATYRYRVTKRDVVRPEDTQVLQDGPEPRLVLVTCYPFNFVGNAPKRYVVTARRS